MNSELFLSMDIETLGPIPGKHPMVELGVAAYDIEGQVVGTWRASITQDGWAADPATMKWWHKPENFQAFQNTKQDAQEPKNAMVAFSKWLQDFANQDYNLVPVAYPAAFDYMFVYWYLMYYIGHSRPLSFSCLDVKSYVCASRKSQYKKTTKRKFPRSWFHERLKHNHTALDDALEQGFLFIQAHRDNLGLPLLKKDHDIGL